MSPLSALKSIAGRLLSLLLLTASASACAASGPYISKNVASRVLLGASATHEFEYVHVKQEDGELIVYGKVRHAHSYCETEGHVDIAILGGNDVASFAGSIPIVRGPSKKPGWYGAAFRARLPIVVADTSSLRLAFHDPTCITGPTFDCGSNAANRTTASSVSTIGEEDGDATTDQVDGANVSGTRD